MAPPGLRQRRFAASVHRMHTTERRRLDALYRATDYCVEDSRLRCVLTVDRPCAALAAWLADQGHDCAAFITACNPYSQVLPDAVNAQRMLDLGRSVESLGLAALAAAGRSRVDGYREPSLLVPGLGLEAAQALMRAFEQNAFVWCGRDARPYLYWTAMREPAR